MKSQFRHIALIGKYHQPVAGGQQASSRQVLERVIHFLHAQGCDVVLEKETAAGSGITGHQVLDVEGMGRECDLALVVGGDGTMLGFGRKLAPHGVPLIGINQGRLGFITDVPFKDIHTALPLILSGEYEEEHRAMLSGSVQRLNRNGGYETIYEGFAINEVLVSRGGTASMIELRVEIDGQFLTNYRADGLIVASPTGSSAYSLSAGGPVLHPGISGWVVVPIAPHTLTNRPIVVPDSGTITIDIVAGRDASMNFDMQGLASLLHGDRVTVRRSRHTIRFLHPKGWNYYATLRRKLRWNEGVA